MHIVELKDSTAILITNATRFYIDKKLNAVIFKSGLRTIAYHNLSNIEKVFEVDRNSLEDYRKSKFEFA